MPLRRGKFQKQTFREFKAVVDEYERRLFGDNSNNNRIIQEWVLDEETEQNLLNFQQRFAKKKTSKRATNQYNISNMNTSIVENSQY